MKKEFNKETVNNAIYDVITRQYKKDCRDAHQLVEDAGYKITKIEGGWKVSNPETNKFVYCAGYNYYKKATKLCRDSYYGKVAWIPNRAECRFDFVNCLDNPRKPWYVSWYEEETSEAVKKYRRLKDAKRSIDWDKRHLAETEKKIAELQRDLVRYAKDIVRDEDRLKDVRKELGLVK